MDIEKLFEIMRTVPDSKLNDTFVGALQLTSEQKDIVNFVFWLCYMAETDLEAVIKNAWKNANDIFPDNGEAEKILINRVRGYRNSDLTISDFLDSVKTISNEDKLTIVNFTEKNYKPKPVFAGLNNLPYFSDKINVHEALLGKTKRNSLLRKLNDIRNDLSHNRFDSLQYEGQSLYLRQTKEKIIEDYFRSALEDDLSKSEIWNSLTEEQREKINRMSKA